MRLFPVSSALPTYEPVAAARVTPKKSNHSEANRPNTKLEALRDKKPISLLPSKQLPLARYLYDRASLRQTIDGEDLVNLKTAQPVVVKGRKKLRNGRGNVSTDLERTNFDTKARVETLRKLAALLIESRLKKDELSKELNALWPLEEVATLTQHDSNHIAKLIGYMARTAAAWLAKNGNCIEHAYTSTTLYASQLDSKSAVSVARNAEHAWTEVTEPDCVRRNNDVIIDLWLEEELAVLRENSRYASNPDKKPVNYQSDTYGYTFDKHSGASFAQGVQKLLTALQSDPVIKECFKQVLSTQKKSNKPFKKLLATGQDYKEALKKSGEDCHEPGSVFSDEFLQQVREAPKQLEATKLDLFKNNEAMQEMLPIWKARAKNEAALLAEVRAAGALRSLGLDIKSATNQANTHSISDRETSIK